ncbi:DUF6730 family protein [Zobellia galactanivorans]|uniref:Hypothetical membrane protein n=1 Tax=Zobellia galactanivorans (strain DSM 12802 / CCUG 47099 / CIP 106680 / NCIMB 13871 / Dsij) TaxID=63186 RepID=G0L6D1_ZOBGA|nr:DUF6730 family protein [Zobellia galactanivorans]CAZ96855.1 Hypothetical membrane protein [Zobellia galactanivorans]
MAKIDDIAELLVEELSDFKLQLEKMKHLSHELKMTQLSPDMTEMSSVLNSFVKSQDIVLREQHTKISQLTKNLSKSNHYPRWLLVLLSSVLLFTFCLVSYSIYEIKVSSDANFNYYEKGQKEAMHHFKNFFEEYPEAKDKYLKWNTNRN